MTYDSGGENAGSALSPEVVLPADVELTLNFTVWQDVEDLANLDFLEVDAVVDGHEYLLWKRPQGFPMKSMETVSVDVSSLQGLAAGFRFTFDTVDGEYNSQEGVYLDDVEVDSTCMAIPCDKDLDCWSAGIGGECTGGMCDFSEVLGTITVFGSSGADPGQFDNPFGVATPPSGEVVFVSDKLNHRVQVFDHGGSFLHQIGESGSGEGQFKQPHGLAAADDRLYVADTLNHRVQVFTHTGVPLFDFGDKGDGEGFFDDPKDVGLTTDGEVLYVADTSNHRVQVFGKDGGFLFEFGEYGKSGGQFRSPSCVLTTPDFRILVCDTDNDRIQEFDFDGSYLGKIDPLGEDALYYPYGATILPDGQLVVADSYHHRLEFFTTAWDLWNRYGTPGTGDGQFVYPLGVASGPDGRLYVADASNDRVVVIGRYELP